MQNGKDTHEAADVSPLLRDTQKTIAALPADDAVTAATQITAALAALNADNALPPTQRYAAISLLDAAALPHAERMGREYLNTSRHTRQREAELWHGAHGCWCELAAGYGRCVQLDAGADESLREWAPVAAARAIHALRRQLQWLRIRYTPSPPALWQSLAAMLLRCDGAGATADIMMYPGVSTTLQREALKTLTLGVLSTENLMPPEQEWAAHLVDRYASEFVLARRPDSGCTHSFDLQHPLAPGRIGAGVPSGSNLRYFGAGTAGASLKAAVRVMAHEQQVPAALGFTAPIEPALLLPVLQQVSLEWTGTPEERRQQREKTNARISVLHGFDQIAGEIDRSTADPFDFTVKAAGESWIASDISSDGFGVVMPAVSGDWVSVGSVLGIGGEAAGAWSVGMVRRVRRLDGGQQHIGVQVLCRHAQVARVMREAAETGNRVTQRMPVDRAILLTPDAMRQPQIELLVSDAALYGDATLHVVTSDGALLVKRSAVEEINADCARIRLAVLGVE